MSRVFRKTERKNKQTTLSAMREDEKKKEEAESEGEINNKSNIKARREVK